jgi:hypothetical protein
MYGKANWRKRKGIAGIRLPDGTITLAELHWCEGHGKVRIIDESGEEYFYPAAYFAPVRLLKKLKTKSWKSIDAAILPERSPDKIEVNGSRPLAPTMSHPRYNNRTIMPQAVSHLTNTRL